MFPYIKTTLMDGGEMWIHHETIAQVYLDVDDGTTTISTTTEDHDFSVQESVETVVQKLKALYNEPETYQPSLQPHVTNPYSTNPYDPEPTINGGW
jgi:uncharacterized protein YlzI (FlbEa/FlbD family)